MIKEMNGEHILKGYDSALAELKKHVISMGRLSYESLVQTSQILESKDINEIEKIYANEDKVDAIEKEVDEQSMHLIMRFQPRAVDLRTILASINVAKNFERISDHTVSIAKYIKRAFKDTEIVLETSFFEPIYKGVDILVSKSIRAFADTDVSLAQSILREDAQVNENCKNSLSDILKKKTELLDKYLHFVFIIRSLERIGDLTKNVAEDIIFIDSAEDIRHTQKSK